MESRVGYTNRGRRKNTVHFPRGVTKTRAMRGVHEPGGGENVKIPYTFHAASTRRAKNTRLAWILR